jgi:hypothetical protein
MPVTANGSDYDGYASDFFDNLDSEGWKYEAVDAAEVRDSDGNGTGNYVGFKVSVPLDYFPANPANIEEIPVTEEDNHVEIYAIPAAESGSSAPYPCFPGHQWAEPLLTLGTNPTRIGVPTIEVSHPDRETATVTDGKVFIDQLAAIEAAMNQLKSDLPTYVDSLDQALAEGVIDPADIISPSAAMSEFAEADSQSGFAARLAFSGIPTPEDLSYQAKVQHPDIQSEDGLWGTLFISFADQQTAANTNVAAGTTLPAADYRQAYLGIYREDNGNWDEILLTPTADDGSDQPIEVLDVDGTTDVEPWEPVEEESTAGANGKVVVWDEETMGEPPDEIKYPADHDGWKIIVQGAATESSHSVSEVEEPTEGETKWVLPSTNLAEGEAIEEIRISGPVKYRQPVDYAQDPGNVNEEKIDNRIDGTQRLIEEIRELENSGVGVGVGPDIDIPTIPGLGVIESAVVVILAILGLNAASG